MTNEIRRILWRSGYGCRIRATVGPLTWQDAHELVKTGEFYLVYWGPEGILVRPSNEGRRGNY